jgi:hypothetical protein
MKNIFCLIIIAGALGACSTAGWYKGMQTREQIQCLNVPEAEYDNCMKNANESYDEYKEKRKELDK